MITDNNIRLTCLHDNHCKLGAKMSPFAGFDMPIQYSSIIDEHNAVRKKVGVFDVSHMGEIFVTGKDSLEFVNHIFTNDVSVMSPNQILYGMMLYENGGTVDDLLVYKFEQKDKYLLVVNAANIKKDYEWLLSNSNGYDVIIDNQSDKWGQIAIQGPLSESTVVDVLGFDIAKDLAFYSFKVLEKNGKEIILSRTGYTGEDGFEIYATLDDIVLMWDKLIQSGVTPCGLGCRDTLRFEAGLPLYGDELSQDISPVMSGLSMFCKLDKQEFIGKEALIYQKTNGVEKKIIGMEVLDKAIPRAGYPIETKEGTVVGVVTTGYRSISLDKSLCFALVEKDYTTMGSELMVRIRKKVFPAIVIKKRFYQPNYKK